MPTEEEDGLGGRSDAGATAQPPPLIPPATINEGEVPSLASPRAVAPESSCSTQEPIRMAGTQDPTGMRAGRRSSSVVYPEAGDVGKPKLFARQSFIVSGEEEEMAETILQARKLAGERRRSTIDYTSAGGQAVAIVSVAQNLAARRDSTTTIDERSTGVAAAASVVLPTTEVAQDPGVARRRSSVLNRIPDNLRALVQQSDASGFQQKTESPYLPGQQQPATTVDPYGSKPDDRPSDVSATTASSVDDVSGTSGTARTSWFRNVLAFVRWKGVGSKKKRKSKDGSKSGAECSTTKSSPFPKSGKARSLLPKQVSKFAGRKQLILDLDETLVHSSFKPVQGADYIVDIEVDFNYYKVFVRKRPGVDEFLARVAKLYEVIIFTASLPQYANPLLDLLDPHGYVTSRLFREQCTFHEGYFVKDLVLVRHQSLESTIIVDNSPMAYMFQPENAIDCASWIDDPEDTELYVIGDFLETIVDVPDVRDLLEFWREGSQVLNDN